MTLVFSFIIASVKDLRMVKVMWCGLLDLSGSTVPEESPYSSKSTT
jgi:hypothetical protein